MDVGLGLASASLRDAIAVVAVNTLEAFVSAIICGALRLKGVARCYCEMLPYLLLSLPSVCCETVVHAVHALHGGGFLTGVLCSCDCICPGRNTHTCNPCSDSIRLSYKVVTRKIPNPNR